MELTGGVDFLQEHLREVVGTFQAEDYHAQVTDSWYLEAIVRLDHSFEFLS